jgi:hypothetical protein
LSRRAKHQVFHEVSRAERPSQQARRPIAHRVRET